MKSMAPSEASKPEACSPRSALEALGGSQYTSAAFKECTKRHGI